MAAVLFGAIRSLRGRQQTRVTRFGIVELLAASETLVLAAMAYRLYRAAIDSAPSTARTVAATIGHCWLLSTWHCSLARLRPGEVSTLVISFSMIRRC